MVEPGAPAFLALWNDFERGREAEYDTWHTREHVPERVAAPGFLSGRRYFDAAHPVHRWFTLYDVVDLGAFNTPEYRDLLDNPTPWSAAMRPGFRNFLRVPCAQVDTAGFGLGAALAMLRVTLPLDLPEGLEGLVAAPGMVRARLGRRVDGGQGVPWRGNAPVSGASGAFDAVLLVEALDRGAARQAFDTVRRHVCPGAQPAAIGGVYDLAFVFPGADPSERAAHRRPSWGAA